MNVLFVCTGNTCRSPIAEKLLEKKVKEKKLNINVKSAGIAAWEGHPVSENTKLILEGYGIDSNHQTRSVTKELLSWADIVLTMTMNHKQILIGQEPDFQEKIYTLKEFALIKSDMNKDTSTSPNVIDPFGGDLETYRKVAEEIATAIDSLLKNELFNKN